MSRTLFSGITCSIPKLKLLNSTGPNVIRNYRVLKRRNTFDIQRRTPWMSSLLSRAMGKSTEERHMTREAAAKQEREKYLAMTVEDKRKLYKCGDKYETLDDVATWEEYMKEYRDDLLKKKRKGAKVEVNHDINKKVSIWQGDITTLEIDAIVNAANNSLLGGGGVDGAIHRGAGSSLKMECSTLNGCDTGDAKITGGHKLPAKYVIHTVGPVGEQEGKLRSCYTKCLKLVKEKNLKSVAFPCISTGIYGYPNLPAAHVAIGTARKFLEDPDTASQIDRIVFCLFLPVDVDIYEELFQYYFPMGESPDSKPDETEEKQDMEEAELGTKKSETEAKAEKTEGKSAEKSESSSTNEVEEKKEINSESDSVKKEAQTTEMDTEDVAKEKAASSAEEKAASSAL